MLITLISLKNVQSVSIKWWAALPLTDIYLQCLDDDNYGLLTAPGSWVPKPWIHVAHIVVRHHQTVVS